MKEIKEKMEINYKEYGKMGGFDVNYRLILIEYGNGKITKYQYHELVNYNFELKLKY